MKDSDILRQLISLAYDSDPQEITISLTHCLDLYAKIVQREAGLPFGVNRTAPRGSFVPETTINPPVPSRKKEGSVVRKFKRGDPCPCCGQPIKSNNPEVLYLLGWISDMRRIPAVEEIESIHRLYEAKKNQVTDGYD